MPVGWKSERAWESVPSDSASGRQQAGNAPKEQVLDHLNCYQILGLKPGASQEQVHRAYKQLALRHHPDWSVGHPENHAMFCQVTEAYSRLKDSFHAQLTLRNVGVCPRCGEIVELFQGMDRRQRYCSTCLLHRRRRYLPLPTFHRIRCVAAITLQSVAFYCVLVSTFTGDWLPGAASILFVIAAMGALAFNFVSADIIEM